jgi:hypothetical protein
VIYTIKKQPLRICYKTPPLHQTIPRTLHPTIIAILSDVAKLAALSKLAEKKQKYGLFPAPPSSAAPQSPPAAFSLAPARPALEAMYECRLRIFESTPRL